MMGILGFVVYLILVAAMVPLAYCLGRGSRPRRSSSWRPDPYTHRGIELSIEIANRGDYPELIRATSDQLYFIAMYGGQASCEPRCLPGCLEHGWHELVPGGGDHGELRIDAPVRVRIRPRLLPAGDPHMWDPADRLVA